jgi:hypothetical protein
VFKEREHKTEDDLSIGHVVSARWRHLPPIFANDLFSRHLKAPITGELSIDISSKPAKIIVKNLSQFLTVCKGLS